MMKHSLSHPQKRIWYSEKLYPETNLYNLSFSFRFDSPVHFPLLEKAINRTVQIHEGLRLFFLEEKGQPLQAIREYTPFSIPFLDFTGPGGDSREADWIKTETRTPLSLSHSQLYRVYLIRYSTGEEGFLLNVHHIACDGWTIGILGDQIKEDYEQLMKGKEIPLSEKPSYRSFLEAEEHYLNSKRFQMNRSFWQEYMADLPEPLKYPVLSAKRGIEKAERLIRYLPADGTQTLRRFCQKEKISLFTLFFSALSLYLIRVTGQEDFIIGTATHNRTGGTEKQTAGMFVNLLPYRQKQEGNPSFLEFLKKTSQEFIPLFRNQKYPFDLLMEDIRKNQGYNEELFQVVFSYENKAISLRNYWNFNGVESFPLVIHLVEREGSEQLKWEIDYKESLFKPEEIESLSNSLLTLVADGIAHPEKRITQLEWIDPQEKDRILHQFNQTQMPYPKDKTVSQLFMEQVVRTPHTTALVYKEKKIPYKEFASRVERLSCRLLQNGLKKGDIVGILSRPSPEMVAAMLAVLQAGGMYFPIDPAYPEDRISYMLSHSQAAILLLQKGLPPVKGGSPRILILEETEAECQEKTPRFPCGRPEDPAYIIFTSGSTGRPKGVVVEQRNLVNLCFWHKTRFQLSEKDHTTQYAGVGFDASVWEIFPTLLSGAALHIIDQETRRDIQKLNRYMEKNRITVSFLPTAVCESFTKLENTSLRILLTGGDRLNQYETRSYELVNNYGPTESTVVAASCSLGKEERPIPIGFPIGNTQIYILDSSRALLPLGIPGELCIGGDGLARGYLNQPELTAERFLPHPFSPGKRIYKTGDLARWLPDGKIEFMGRIDHQVKIRGFRIELGEIESTLLTVPPITEAVVKTVEEKTGKALCAYTVSPEETDADSLREHLSKNLPDYMIPSYFVSLEKLPLTPNGKIDRKALPQPERNASPRNLYQAPSTEMEKLLVQVWEETLGQSPVGIQDNFFYRGGDSIKAIQAASNLQKRGYRLAISDLYENPTIQKLQFAVKTWEKTVSQEILTGAAELTPIQLWFFQQDFRPVHHWNQWVTIEAPAGGGTEVVQKALEALVLHHDALRSVFPEGKRVLIGGTGHPLLHFAVLPEEQHATLHDRIDIEQGPLLVAGWDPSSTPARLSLIIHHLVVDGVSWRILLEDLQTACLQLQRGEVPSLPPKTASFRHWAETLRTFRSNHLLQEEIPFWKKQKEEALLTLKSEHPLLPPPLQKDMALREIRLNRKETGELLNGTHQAYNTAINDLLLCALSLSYRDWKGEPALLLNLEGHGREDLEEGTEVSRTVGWFTTTFPVLLDLRGEQDLSLAIPRTKETLRKIPRKGIGYGILRYLSQREEESIVGPDPEISFNYLGVFPRKTNLQLSMAPECTYPYGLDINGLVEDGCLRLLFRYDSRRYDAPSIGKLSELYHSRILEIIRHCAEKKGSTKTPSDYGDISLTEKELAYLPEECQRVYALTPLQEGMLLSHIKEPETGAYFERFSFTAPPPFDLPRFKEKWDAFIERHDILRTVFAYENMGKPRQIVLNRVQKGILYHDLRPLSDPEKDQFMEDLKQKDRNTPFSLTTAPPYRLTVLQEDENRYRMIFSFHHILMDGWSLGIFFRELFLIPSPKQGDYYRFLQWRDRQNHQEAALYWQDYLQGYEKTAKLPGTQRTRGSFDQKECHFPLDQEATERLTAWARRTGVTQAALFQAAWGLLLQRYNRTEDVIFGFVLSGRPPEIPDAEKMLGLFINTIPVRVASRPGMSFPDLVKKVQAGFHSSEKYSYCSLAEIQARSGFKEGLFNHIVAFENYPLPEELKAILRDVEVFEQADYDFNLIVVPGETLDIRIRYNAKAFRENQIRETGRQLLILLRHISRKGDALLEELNILTQEEEKQLLQLSQGPQSPYPSKTIHQIFEEKAKETPHKTALVFDGKEMSYGELNRKAASLAAYLIRQGVGTQSIIGVHLYRSFDMLIAILGILKARCAYLPLDPDIPEKRKRQILEDSGTEHLIIQGTGESPAFFNGNIHKLEPSLYDAYEGIPLERKDDPSDLAYVIYTSGSTGKPKGVLVEHRNAVNTLSALEETYPMGESDAFLLKTPYSFDVSVTEFFSWFFGWGRLIIMKGGEEKEPEKIITALREHGISHLNFVPSMLDLFLEELKKTDLPSLKNFRYLFSAGESISASMIQKFHSLFQTVRLVNLYGPTEAAIYATGITLGREEESDPVTIGRPLANTAAYILSGQNTLCSPGVPGELCLSGAGIARGYLNRPGLTEEKFIPNPFTPGKRMYRTGDLARWSPGGEIAYLGRLDKQVKIRGNRVEPGEVETCLQTYPGISKALVIPRDDARGLQYLAAYYLSENSPSASALRKHIAAVLPSYMIPAYCIKLDAFPLSSHGKLDRTRLPEPAGVLQTEEEYIAPRNEREEEIDAIWQEVLGIERVGVHDNFFDLGGNSIKAIQVYSRLSKRYDICMNDIFEYETIASLSLHIQTRMTDLKKRLDRIKTRTTESSTPLDLSVMMDEMRDYNRKNSRYLLMDLENKKNYRQILLTGATGFLGVHVFKELLENTDAVIHPLIRGKNLPEAEKRLRQKLRFYLDQDIYKEYSHRIQPIRGNLGQDRFGMPDTVYAELVDQIDCILNCAANVRHYGHYKEFEEINVKGVERLIRLAGEGQRKDLNHISTMSVGLAGIEDKKCYIFHEYETSFEGDFDNVYLRSKLKAEALLLQAREKGLRTSIFRVGNLVFHSKTGKFQENIKENAFYTSVKSYIKIGACPEINHTSLDFSYIDCASRAIVLLFDKKELQNEIHHIINPHLISINTLGKMIRNAGYPLEIQPFEEFLDFMYANHAKKGVKDDILNILLHSHGMEDPPILGLIPLSLKTNQILQRMHFNWPEPDEERIGKMLDYCREVNFL